MTRPRRSPRLALLRAVASGTSTRDLLRSATGLRPAAFDILARRCVREGLLTVCRGRYSRGPGLAVWRGGDGAVRVGVVQTVEILP